MQQTIDFLTVPKTIFFITTNSARIVNYMIPVANMPSISNKFKSYQHPVFTEKPIYQASDLQK
jgi:hypothetical protein